MVPSAFLGFLTCPLVLTDEKCVGTDWDAPVLLFTESQRLDIALLANA